MATLARPGRPLAPRVQRAYRLEMAGRTVFLLLTLLALTGLVVFYLGVITGKGLRDPNEGVVVNSTTAPGTAAIAPGSTDPKTAAPVQSAALNHALQSPTGQIEGLKKEEGAANQKTQQLVANAKQELALDEVKPSGSPAAPTSALTAPAAKTTTQPGAKPAAPAQTAKKPATVSTPAQPAKRPAAVAKAPMAPATPANPASAAADADGPFVVQVFSSPQQTHAQEILADLKKKGFPAYMNQFQAADKRTWYRVRVGKSIGSRTEADSLATRVRSSASNLEPRVMKQ